MITGVLFYAFAAVLIVAALGVITTRNPVHSALFLVLAFVQSAGHTASHSLHAMQRS